MLAKQWEFRIDRGGTFTDIVARTSGGAVLAHKPLSENPEQYAVAAVKMGTTVATNAFLGRNVETVLLLVIEGFGDLLKIDHQTRLDDVYSHGCVA